MKQRNEKKEMKKSAHILVWTILIVSIFPVLFFFLGSIPLSVRVWQPLVKAELQKYDMEEYTPIVLAIIKQESGGKKLDIMQSSESIDLPPNTIKNPLTSIKTGVDYFKQSIDRMDETNVDLNTAIQSYNYGLGYIDYVKANGGKHNAVLSKKFSTDWAKKMNWETYGDSDYVYKINDYKKTIPND